MACSFREKVGHISELVIARMAAVYGGVIASYKFAENGNVITDVVCIPFGDKVKQRVSGASVVDRAESYIIPVTDTWPGANTPQPYDIITYNGVVGWVDKASWDNLNARWKVVLKYREDI